MAESQRTGRVSFVLFDGKGREVQVWTKPATLELRDDIAPIIEEFRTAEQELREEYPDYYEYSRLIQTDAKAGMAMLANSPDLQERAKEVNQRVADAKIRNAFRLIKSVIDVADSGISSTMKEQIAQPTDTGDFWRRQPIPEVIEAAARFRNVAEIRG